MDKEESVFEKLYALNLSSKVEKKNNLTYLSWAHAWSEFKKHLPEATYEVVEYNGSPFCYDENLGYIVKTYVIAGGLTIPMHLPVLDGANKAMKSKAYQYKTKFADKTVEAATMFDINTAIMRCLVKNIAMFGLGIYIYAGEDLPESQETTTPKTVVPVIPKQVAVEPKPLQPSNEFNTLTDIKAVVDERKEKAKKALADLNNTPAILKHIIADLKLKFTDIPSFVDATDIEEVENLYRKFNVKK